MVGDVLEHGDAAGAGKQVLHAGQLGTAHGAQNAARKLVAGDALDLLGGRHENGDVAGGACLAGTVNQSIEPGKLMIGHQHAQRLVAAGKRTLDHLLGFGNENPLLRLELVAQLQLGQAQIGVQALIGKA